jgi:predicted dehydrogenase
MHSSDRIDRRGFLRTAAAGALAIAGASAQTRRIKTAIVGCGSVSGSYLPHMTACPYIEMVSVCDIVVERAEQRAKKFNVPNFYDHIDKMLAGPDFEFLVNLTGIPTHYEINKRGLEAGKNVWSEKTMAQTYEDGRRLLDLAKARGVRIWGAPTAVLSPQFKFMAQTLAAGKLGRLAAAHASYGHTGPDWASFFYEKGGGSMPDLMVYDLTVLTGLLGPAREVIAAGTIVTPTRDIIRDHKVVRVEAEDNAMVTMYHDQGVLSHAQSGFNYFDEYEEHTYTGAGHRTIDIIGREGEMHLAGYCWAPIGVDLGTRGQKMKRYADEPHDYVWQNGASHIAECMVKGVESLLVPEHALHIADIIHAANESQRTGRRVPLQSTFRWPIPV